VGLLLTVPAEDRLLAFIAEQHIAFGEEKAIMDRLVALAQRRGDKRVRKTDVEHLIWERAWLSSRSFTNRPWHG
jgi:hypothetical protein